jgi:subtilisin family serine protease
MSPRLVLKGRITLRLTEGRELEHVATHRDVRLGASAPAWAIDRGGRIDQALRRHTPALLATRAFQARAGLARQGCGHLGWDSVERSLGLARTLRIRVDPDAALGPLLEDLRSLADVEMASPEFLATVPASVAQGDPSSTPESGAVDDGRAFDERALEPGRSLIHADEALELEPGDSALIVGLVDSGVNLEHAELSGRLRPGISSVAITQQAVEDDMAVISGARPGLQDVDDDQGHGTTCGSLLSANGFCMPRGLAGASRLLPVRALCGARARGRTRITAIGSIQDIDSGLKTAVDLGARVINLSFGTPESALEPNAAVPHVEVVRYALARDCTLVAASGNSGRAERYFPAALPGVIAVGAIGSEGVPAAFTTHGDHVALCAPGAAVRAARLEGYSRVNGTSFAAPLVAGACALLLARAARRSLVLPAASVRQILIDSASPWRAGVAPGYGAGVLDVLRALRAIDDWARPMHEAA